MNQTTKGPIPAEPSKIAQQIRDYNAAFDAAVENFERERRGESATPLASWHTARVRRALQYAEIDQRAGMTDVSARAFEAFTAPSADWTWPTPPDLEQGSQAAEIRAVTDIKSYIASKRDALQKAWHTHWSVGPTSTTLDVINKVAASIVLAERRQERERTSK